MSAGSIGGVRALDLPPRPWVVAHRGDASELENTIASCSRAVELGAHMVELDLQLTADGELVVFHDWDLQRLGGRNEVVEELPAARVVGSPLAVVYRGRRLAGAIPTLAALLGSLPPGQPVNLELKRRLASREAMVRRLGELVAGRAQLLVSSFDWELLAVVRKVLPGMPVAPIASRGAGPLLAAGIELEAFSLHCHHRLARRLLAAEHRLPVLVYTVNRLDAARRWVARGAAGIFTDSPGPLLQGLPALPQNGATLG